LAERPGFTLIELLVVIAIIAVLASLLLPVLVMARMRAQTAQCISNMKQMQTAWFLYSTDNQDYLAPNSDATGGSHGRDAADPSWVAGDMYLVANNLSDLDESTNMDYLVGRQFAPFGSLGLYTLNGKIYHCPADNSRVAYNGASYPRVRSISMNGWVGYDTRDWSQPAAPPFYKLNVKLSDIVHPGPSGTWVFIDERENSINDGWFALDMVDRRARATWLDLPATRHNHGAVLSFADGHAEYKHWQDPRTLLSSLTPATTTTITIGAPGTPSPNNADIAWLQQHTTGTQ
jgi:prepilin-type N-terminal cleavage/methylation domain-containing protein/prepilin-type processing-associated H-X9-DG protein